MRSFNFENLKLSPLSRRTFARGFRALPRPVLSAVFRAEKNRIDGQRLDPQIHLLGRIHDTIGPELEKLPLRQAREQYPLSCKVLDAGRPSMADAIPRAHAAMKDPNRMFREFLQT